MISGWTRSGSGRGNYAQGLARKATHCRQFLEVVRLNPSTQLTKLLTALCVNAVHIRLSIRYTGAGVPAISGNRRAS